MCKHNSSTVINPLHCVVPPHILKEILKRGEQKHKDWALHTLAVSERLKGNREIMGELLGLLPSAGQQKRRTIYDAKAVQTLPGKRVRGEGDPASKDVEVNEAYDGAGATYDLYKN